MKLSSNAVKLCITILLTFSLICMFENNFAYGKKHKRSTSQTKREGNLYEMGRRLRLDVNEDKYSEDPFSASRKKREEEGVSFDMGGMGYTGGASGGPSGPGGPGSNPGQPNDKNPMGNAKDYNPNSENFLDSQDTPKAKKAAEKLKQDRIGYYDPNLGTPNILKSRYIPNRYPSCLLKNELNRKFNGDKQRNQLHLKKCGLVHVFKSIDMNKALFKQCAKNFRLKFGNHKGYGYLLSSIIIYANKKDDDKFRIALRNVCTPSFIDQFLQQSKHHEVNLKIALSLFSDLANPTKYPPNVPPGKVLTDGGRKKRRLRLR